MFLEAVYTCMPVCGVKAYACVSVLKCNGQIPLFLTLGGMSHVRTHTCPSAVSPDSTTGNQLWPKQWETGMGEEEGMDRVSKAGGMEK